MIAILRALVLPALCLMPLLAGAGEAVKTAEATVHDRPLLGVKIDENPFDKQLGLPVTEVVANSTAATMGIIPGDLLKSLNGSVLQTQQDLQKQLAALKVGAAVNVEVVRGSETKQLSGTMQQRPRTENPQVALAKAQADLKELQKQAGGAREPSLAEVLQQLSELQRKLPEAVAAFKKQYPNGEFKIKIDIDIVSDKTAKDPVDLMQQDPEALPKDPENPDVAPKP